MIISTQGARITADQAARHLVESFGGQLSAMSEGEWDWVIKPHHLTEREAQRIREAINKHASRVRRLLFPKPRKTKS
jgi:hypothetical protein